MQTPYKYHTGRRFKTNVGGRVARCPRQAESVVLDGVGCGMIYHPTASTTSRGRRRHGPNLASCDTSADRGETNDVAPSLGRVVPGFEEKRTHVWSSCSRARASQSGTSRLEASVIKARLGRGVLNTMQRLLWRRAVPLRSRRLCHRCLERECRDHARRRGVAR